MSATTESKRIETDLLLATAIKDLSSILAQSLRDRRPTDELPRAIRSVADALVDCSSCPASRVRELFEGVDRKQLGCQTAQLMASLMVCRDVEFIPMTPLMWQQVRDVTIPFLGLRQVLDLDTRGRECASSPAASASSTLLVSIIPAASSDKDSRLLMDFLAELAIELIAPTSCSRAASEDAMSFFDDLSEQGLKFTSFETFSKATVGHAPRPTKMDAPASTLALTGAAVLTRVPTSTSTQLSLSALGAFNTSTSSAAAAAAVSQDTSASSLSTFPQLPSSASALAVSDGAASAPTVFGNQSALNSAQFSFNLSSSMMQMRSGPTVSRLQSSFLEARSKRAVGIGTESLGAPGAASAGSSTFTTSSNSSSSGSVATTLNASLVLPINRTFNLGAAPLPMPLPVQLRAAVASSFAVRPPSALPTYMQSRRLVVKNSPDKPKRERSVSIGELTMGTPQRGTAQYATPTKVTVVSPSATVVIPATPSPTKDFVFQQSPVRQHDAEVPLQNTFLSTAFFIDENSNSMCDGLWDDVQRTPNPKKACERSVPSSPL